MTTQRLGATTGKAIDWLSIIGGWLAGIFILLMSLIVFYEVVSRYVFNSPTIWSLEITEYLVVLAGFTGAAYVLKENRHIVVDVLTSMLVEKTRTALQVVVSLLMLTFSIMLFWFGLQVLLTSLVRHEVSYSLLRFPMWVPKLAIPLGMFLLTLQTLKLLITSINSARTMPGEFPRGFTLQNPWVLLPLFIAGLVGAAVLLKFSSVAGLILFLFVILFGGVPVAFGLGLTGATALIVLMGGLGTLLQTPQIGFSALLSFTLSAIPMFIMGAAILGRGGIAQQLYELATKWAGHLPGGLAIATMLSAGAFAAISGSTIATSAAIGIIALPQMLNRGYDKRLSYGTVASGGCLGTMIPPSLSFILIGSIVNISVGRMFIAGIFPGILMMVAMSLTIYLMCRGGKRYQPMPPAPWKARFRAFGTSFWGLLAPVIIIGGIYIGIFTPTEAAAVSVIYGFLVSIVIIRSVGWREFLGVVSDGARTTAMLLFIVAGASILGHVVTLLQVPQKLVMAITAANLSPWVLVAAVTILLLILGCFLEAAAIILITVPIVFPAAMALGIDPIWFAVIFNLNLEIGMITPPVGMTLYTVKAIVADSKMSDIIMGAFPFVITLLIVLLIIMFVPQISTWLPNLMMGK